MNALAAYNAGASGRNVGIAIIDSGIDLNSAEFENRVSAASQDVAGNASIQDVDGHGTAVAFTAAGRRNGVGTQGVAFAATLMIYRADAPGTCGSADGCMFSTDAIATALDAARVAGAKVVNISLGGTSLPSTVVDAIGRATAAGMVVVVAAGNDGAADPDAFAQVANDAAARGQVIVAGSIDASGTLATSSNRAGNTAAHYLAAVGEQVRAPNHSGTAYLWSGTSFAAPQVAAAAALLAQAFPNLTGAQIVDLLLTTARDAGATGTDAQYGRGILDLTRAFQPVGTLTVAGTTRTVAAVDGAVVLSSAMGDARGGTLGAVVLAGFDRAYAMTLASGIARQAVSRPLNGLTAAPSRQVAMQAGDMAVALTIAARPNGTVGLNAFRLGLSEARRAQAVAGSVAQRLGRTTQFALGFAEDAGTLSLRLAGQAMPAFLVGDGLNRFGFEADRIVSSGLRQEWAGFGVTAAVEQGDALYRRADAPAALRRWSRSGYSTGTVALDRRWGGLFARIAATRLDEADSALGTRFPTNLGATRATSWFVDGNLRLDAGGGWSLGGAWRQGWTRIGFAGAQGGGGDLVSRAFAADIGKDGVLGQDSLGIRIVRPLRVASGSVGLLLPTQWDYASERVSGWTPQRIALAPTGRETDWEGRYAFRWGGAWVNANAYLRQNPGNIADARDDYGVAIRFSRPF